MNLRKKHLLILALIVISLVVLSSLALVQGTLFSVNLSSSNDTGDGELLSEADGQSLKAAYEEYAQLRQTLSAQEARTTLIEQLTQEDGVDTVDLGIDGYSIFVRYDDGACCMVDTFEYDETNQTEGTGFAPVSSYPSDYVRTHTLSFDPLRWGYVPETSAQKITAQSKKVLFLGPAYYEFPKEFWDDSVTYFQNNGWTEEDILIKVNDVDPLTHDYRFGNVKPEDYYNMQDYGIILFNGHGGIHYDYNEDNLYLQFCFFSNKSLEENPAFKKQLLEWNQVWRLLITDCHYQDEGGTKIKWYETHIRLDLLKEKMNLLPGSYVYLATCYGGYFQRMFRNKGATVFLGYDEPTSAYYADGNMFRMNTLLLEEPCSVYDSYLNDTIVKEHEFQGKNVHLQLFPDPLTDTTASSFYFPAWISKLTITNIPDQAYTVRVNLYDNDSNLIVSQDYDVSSSSILIEDFNDLIRPATEELLLEVQAFNMNSQEIASQQATVRLDAGENEVTIGLGALVWYLSGSEEPNTPIDSVYEAVRLNDEPVFEFQGYYPSFGAAPGDSLRIFYITTRYYGYCDYMGPIWLLCPNKNFVMKLTDGVDLGCYYGETPEVGVILYDQTFIIPEP